MIFEPHRYTRTQQLFDDFVKVLSKVDFLLLLDIYPASEKPIKGISSKKIAFQISKNHKNAHYLGSQDPIDWLLTIATQPYYFHQAILAAKITKILKNVESTL